MLSHTIPASLFDCVFGPIKITSQVIYLIKEAPGRLIDIRKGSFLLFECSQHLSLENMCVVPHRPAAGQPVSNFETIVILNKE